MAQLYFQLAIREQLEIGNRQLELASIMLARLEVPCFLDAEF
jgi:hypothetical protein